MIAHRGEIVKIIKEIVDDLRSIIAMKLMSLALSISPHGEKARFVGIIYASYGSITLIPDGEGEGRL